MAVSDAAQQAWPPFVLVAGLLMIGVVAHAEGLFARAGELLERVPGPPVTLLAASIGVVTVVTAVLNLDTAVVFLTPILVLAARARGIDEEPFLYAAVFMANASSLYLPGSNLTNLLVLARDPLPGSTFAARLWAPALAATLVTAAGICLLFARALGTRSSRPRPIPTRAGGLGVVAVLAAAGLTVGLARPALPVACVGVLAVACELARGRLDLRRVVQAVGPAVLALLFAASVALGTLARHWHGPASLLAGAGDARTAAIGALGAVGLNNLPATVLLSARPLAHPRALLIGLNLGPNLAVTGSLSAYLWFRAARAVGACPSIAGYSRRGMMLAPLAIVAALAAARAVATPL